MTLNKKLDWRWLAGLIAILAISRLIPHPPNFTPVIAMAILTGTLIKDLRISLIIPLLAMLLSDLILGLHSSLLFVYAAIALIVFANRLWIKKLSVLKLGVSAFASSVLFFLITNFGAWLSHDLYPHTASGLLQAYIAGIPFFHNTVLSTLLFTGISILILTYAPRKLASY